ncbi:GNAT family N-acetyltransferase [Microbulbifer sp. ALW1]|uniref:GNAT family N-acetyltransferase n=1 Tax=Microbulbifer sp. (strain ALW1) TaxID=1516059 RepID=UPI0013598C9B|nr:GNAT family N-acetyltransferase [Microbulbifer sp. ALW1]
MEVRIVSVGDAAQLSRFYKENEEHLRAWEPRRDSGYHSVEAWKHRLKQCSSTKHDSSSVHFVLTESDCDNIMGICFLTNIVKGPFMACNMGYAVACKYEGKGFMKILCQKALDYAFKELTLNRVMANYMPSNHRSAKLLKSLGFTKEGEAKRYLKINGSWEDHVLTSLLNPGNT